MLGIDENFDSVARLQLPICSLTNGIDISADCVSGTFATPVGETSCQKVKAPKSAGRVWRRTHQWGLEMARSDDVVRTSPGAEIPPPQ